MVWFQLLQVVRADTKKMIGGATPQQGLVPKVTQPHTGRGAGWVRAGLPAAELKAPLTTLTEEAATDRHLFCIPGL